MKCKRRFAHQAKHGEGRQTRTPVYCVGGKEATELLGYGCSTCRYCGVDRMNLDGYLWIVKSCDVLIYTFSRFETQKLRQGVVRGKDATRFPHATLNFTVTTVIMADSDTQTEHRRSQRDRKPAKTFLGTRYPPISLAHSANHTQPVDLANESARTPIPKAII
jgi:hypothetical protein